MYLDPIKVTILTPGMSKEGEMQPFGIPASIVAKYLDERGIIVEKTGPYNLLFLFSIGIDKTKALSLLRAMTDFKRSFDLNLRVKTCCLRCIRKRLISMKTCAFRIWRRTFTARWSNTTCRI